MTDFSFCALCFCSAASRPVGHSRLPSDQVFSFSSHQQTPANFWTFFPHHHFFLSSPFSPLSLISTLKFLLHFYSLWTGSQMSSSSISYTICLILISFLLLFHSLSHLTPISSHPGSRISPVTETGCGLIVLFQPFFPVKSQTAGDCTKHNRWKTQVKSQC